MGKILVQWLVKVEVEVKVQAFLMVASEAGEGSAPG